MLPKNAIIQFQMIYKQVYGIELDFDESKQKAENFIQLFDLVTRKDEYEKLESSIRTEADCSR